MLEYVILVVFVVAAVSMAVTLVRKRFQALYALLFSFALFVLGVVGQCTVTERQMVEEEPLSEDGVFAHILYTPQQAILDKTSEWFIYCAGILLLCTIVFMLIKKLCKR